jgi:hypothetical protein
MIEVAIIAPEVISWRMTSQAPKPSSATCSPMRSDLAAAPIIAERIAAALCGADAASRFSCQASSQLGSMPMATSASALRTAASASPIAAMASTPDR